MPRNKTLSSVLKKIESATGLANEHYISKKQHQIEKCSVMFKNWSGLAFGKDIPNVGDIKPIHFLGLPLLIVRTNENVINVFENTCRHRGMTLVDKKQSAKKNIRCPYHNWCYALNGALTSTPHVGGVGVHEHKDINPSSLGLNQIRSYVWKDIIFINVSGTAKSFTQNFSQLITRWQDFEQTIVYGKANSSFSLSVQANWKLIIENYCESYHLPNIHPNLNKTSKLEDHYDICDSAIYSGQGSYNYRQLSDNEDAVLTDFKNLSVKWHQGSEYIAIYPNVLMGVHRDNIFCIILESLSVTETKERIALYYSKLLKPSNQINALKTKNMKFWKKIFEEDIFVVEGMQKGRYGNMFNGGKFSPIMDRPTHNFHGWVATQIDQANTSEKE